jgi:PEP-CTERM motif
MVCASSRRSKPRLKTRKKLDGEEKGWSTGIAAGPSSYLGESHMETRLLAGALATCALLGLAPSGLLANVLSSGDTGVAPDAFTAPSSFTILTSAPERAFSSVDFDFIADLFEAVISDPTNVFGAGDLDFIIVVGNDNDSSHNIERVTTSSFAGFKTDVGYFTGFPGIPPDTVDRLTASTIGFNFMGGIAPGSDSAQIAIETNATRFTSGFLSAFNMGSATTTGFAPAVPEPSTWAMIMLGFASLAVAGYLASRGTLGHQGSVLTTRDRSNFAGRH